MLSEFKRLTCQLPTCPAILANAVYTALTPVVWPMPDETRTALALSAGLRDVVDSQDIPGLMSRVFAHGSKMELVKLLGFADARCRKAIASWLSHHPEIVGMLAEAIGVRSVLHSRRINGIFRAAIKYAENI